MRPAENRRSLFCNAIETLFILGIVPSPGRSIRAEITVETGTGYGIALWGAYCVVRLPCARRGATQSTWGASLRLPRILAHKLARGPVFFNLSVGVHDFMRRRGVRGRRRERVH